MKQIEFVAAVLVAAAIVAGSAVAAADTAGCDPAAGQKVYALCAGCHALRPDDPPREGPTLHGIFGRKAGTLDAKFDYSPALKSSNWSWDFPTLDKYLKNPRFALPGGRMKFLGLKSVEERRAVSCFLQQDSAATQKR
jgi:cytochrome c